MSEHTDELNLRLYQPSENFDITGDDGLNSNFTIIDEEVGKLSGIGEEIIINSPTTPTEKTRIIVSESFEEVEYAEMSDLDEKTSKVRIDFDGTNFKIDGQTINYQELYEAHLPSPDFAFVVYGDRAYLLSYVQDDAGMKEMRFQSVLAVTDANNLSYVKTSGIYVISTDGVNIASVRVTDINSENKAYKATEINDNNRNSDVMYPSVKAVADANASLSESIDNIYNVTVDIGAMTTGKYLTTNGALGDDSGSKVSDFIYIGNRITNRLSLSNVFVRGSRCCASFNSNKQFVRYLAAGTAEKNFIVDLLDEEKYIRITTVATETSSIKYVDIIKRKNAFVDGANGSDANDGSEYYPYKTIQKAIDSGHEHIFVSNTSVYNGQRIYMYNKHGITIQPWYYRNYDTTVPNNLKIKIDCANAINSGVIANQCSDITFIGIEVYNTTDYGYNFVNCENIRCHSCVAHDTFRDGFRLVNVDGSFKDCLAYNIGDASVVHADGFNIHGYGDTIFQNCVAHDCIDDGISHHDACTGVIDGGEYYNCGKGGVASPTHGAKINVYNVRSHHNAYGLYTALEDGKTQKDSIIANNLFHDNTNTGILANAYHLIGFGNVLRNNTRAIQSMNGGYMIAYESNQ